MIEVLGKHLADVMVVKKGIKIAVLKIEIVIATGDTEVDVVIVMTMIAIRVVQVLIEIVEIIKWVTCLLNSFRIMQHINSNSVPSFINIMKI